MPLLLYLIVENEWAHTSVSHTDPRRGQGRQWYTISMIGLFGYYSYIYAHRKTHFSSVFWLRWWWWLWHTHTHTHIIMTALISGVGTTFVLQQLFSCFILQLPTTRHYFFDSELIVANPPIIAIHVFQIKWIWNWTWYKLDKLYISILTFPLM